MKIYFMVVGFVLYVGAAVGLILPFLFSAASWELVAAGLCVVTLFLPTAFSWGAAIVTQIVNLIKTKKLEKNNDV